MLHGPSSIPAHLCAQYHGCLGLQGRRHDVKPTPAAIPSTKPTTGPTPTDPIAPPFWIDSAFSGVPLHPVLETGPANPAHASQSAMELQTVPTIRVSDHLAVQGAAEAACRACI
jgi:hypothetical protein